MSSPPLRSLLRLLPLLLCCVVATAAAAQSERPNILLVLSDDHSAAFVGCYGNPSIRTPNLDRFAAEGMRFDRMYVASPQCVPSRAAMMSGRSPVRIGMTRFSAPLPADVTAFPEVLRSGGGYYTGICGRGYHLDGSRLPPESKEIFDRHELKTFRKRVDYLPQGFTRERIPDLMRAFFDGAPKGKPFFLQVGFSDPHRPLDRDAIPQPHDPAKLVLPPYFPDTPLLREDLGRYCDEIARLDSDFARVLQVLEERGAARNTIVVFMGDNGGAVLRGKGTLNELGIRVPFLVRWPGVVKPGATAELVSGEDLAPTFLEAAGQPVPKEMTGRSFLKLLRGQPSEGRRFVFSERGAHGSGLPNSTGAFDLGRCVVSKTHKLIYNALWQLPYSPVDFAGDPFWKEIQAMHREGKLSPELDRLYFPPARPMFELYDLSADPHEMNNLTGKPDHAQVERELKAALQEWMILERDYLPLPIPPGVGD
jgi:N-sulfoglucosamine sulfohydrolase